jgi:hypothetical protein
MSAILFGPISIVELVADSANSIADLSAFRRIGKRFKHLSVPAIAERFAPRRCFPNRTDHLPADLHHEAQEMRRFEHQQVGRLQAAGVELTAFETYFAIPK